ncbi:MAG: hypothetical protein OHK0032_05380 [Thermodesulfovibrionales bacterium]
MKKYMGITMILMFMLVILVPSLARSGDFDGLKEAKVVWDVTSGDEKVFTDRINLIQQTAESLKQRGITPVFVIGIRGHATKFVTKSVDGTKFEKDKIEQKDEIQQKLLKVAESGIKIKQCSMPMKRFNVAKDNVVKFVEVVDNVWENMIALQNKGYAYIVP